jgi:hypothetical protein
VSWFLSFPLLFLFFSSSFPLLFLFFSYSVLYNFSPMTLRSRFIHVRVLLYRPIFTQLCAQGVTEAPSSLTSGVRSPKPSDFGKNRLYSSFAIRCANSCVEAAIDLIILIHEHYRTPATGAWWYNGFCTSHPFSLLLRLQFRAPP